MSENWKYQASVKVGDVMHNVRGEDSQEFEKNLLEFPVAAAAQFQANVAGGQSLGQITQPIQQLQQQPQQASVPQPGTAQPPAWAQQQPSNVVPIQQPQGGRVCQECGQPLIAKQTSAGKNVWRCDAWRWNNGNPNNHTSLKPGEGF